MKPLRARDIEQSTRLGDRRGTADQVADISNLIAVIMFSVIGLLIAANLMLRFPNLAPTAEQFNTFAAL